MTIQPDSPLARAYDEIELIRASLASATAALTDERRAYEAVTRRRDELAAEVQAAEAAAQEYRRLLLILDHLGQLSEPHQTALQKLDRQHAAVFETHESCNYP